MKLGTLDTCARRLASAPSTVPCYPGHTVRVAEALVWMRTRAHGLRTPPLCLTYYLHGLQCFFELLSFWPVCRMAQELLWE